jgi:hypothetical protein
VVNCGRKTAQEWDEGEAHALRSVVLPELTELPSYAEISAAFEKAIASDPSAAASLLSLVSHANEDVAASSAAALGRFPTPAVSSRLKHVFETETRTWVRIGALVGLERVRDPEAGHLAARALSDPDLLIQAAGGAAIVRLGDTRFGPELIAYYEEHRDEQVILEWLGCVGDAPGSTVVRDRLLAEANNKTLDFSRRVRAARGLEEMGQAALVQRVLDRQKGNQTHQSLGATIGAVRRLAAKKGLPIRNQADVDALLREANLGHHGDDLWGHPIRLGFVREGVTQASSDGPDSVPETEDDLTSSESYGAWAFRVFPEQF